MKYHIPIVIARMSTRIHVYHHVAKPTNDTNRYMSDAIANGSWGGGWEELERGVGGGGAAKRGG